MLQSTLLMFGTPSILPITQQVSSTPGGFGTDHLSAFIVSAGGCDGMDAACVASVTYPGGCSGFTEAETCTYLHSPQTLII